MGGTDSKPSPPPPPPPPPPPETRTSAYYSTCKISTPKGPKEVKISKKTCRQVKDPPYGDKINLSNFDINLKKNLFIGFKNNSEADKNFELLAQAKEKFPDKMKDVNLKNSIIINGQINKNSNNKTYIQNICLGADDKEYDVNIKCLNAFTIDGLQYPYHGMPRFKDNRNNVVQDEDKSQGKSSKLCFYDEDSEKEICIEPKHIDMINGKKAVKLKMKDGCSDNYKEISPRSVEYGPKSGFANLENRIFYMNNEDQSSLQNSLNNTETCFDPTRGRQRHFTQDAHPNYNSKASYLFNPKPDDKKSYSHIHAHYDKAHDNSTVIVKDNRCRPVERLRNFPPYKYDDFINWNNKCGSLNESQCYAGNLPTPDAWHLGGHAGRCEWANKGEGTYKCSSVNNDKICKKM